MPVRPLVLLIASVLACAGAVAGPGAQPALADPRVVATIPVGSTPLAPAVTPDGATVLVPNSGSGTVSVIDVGTRTVRATVEVGQMPANLAISPNGRLAWVSNVFDSTVSVIDIGSASVVATIPVAASPFDLVVSADGDTVYVASTASTQLSVIDVDTRAVHEVAMPVQATNLALTPDGSTLVVTPVTAPVVSVMDTDTELVTAANYLPGGLNEVATTDSTAFLSSSEGLAVLDLAALTVVTFPTGNLPQDVALSPDGRIVTVTNELSGTISVFDVATQTMSQVQAKDEPVDITFAPDGARALVVFPNSNKAGIWQVGAGRVSAVAVGQGPYAGVFTSPDEVYIANQNGGTVSVVVDPPDPLPGPPRGVTAESANRGARVSWQAPADPGTSPIRSYTVQGARSGSAVPGATCTTSSTSCRVGGLRNGIAYTFTVVARNGSGTGPASMASPAVTPAPPPLRRQTVGLCGRLPQHVRSRGLTRLPSRSCRTNAGQRLTITASAAPRGARARTLRFVMERHGHGRFIRTLGHAMNLTITLSAAATARFAALERTRIYRVRR